MFAMHPTLLVGPADWDAARLPKEEFLGRIATFWRDADPGIAGVVVYGSPCDHAELAYLTHFTPKLEPAIALIPRGGEPRLLVGGGANMIGAAKPLTWVETLLPLRDAGQTIARWSRELGSGGIALVNGGAMRFGLRQEIVTALGAPPPDVTGMVAAAMRRKSVREVALLRDACASLSAAFAAMREAQQTGRSMTDTVLAGERAAWQRGAQDVRSAFGRDNELAPFTVPVGEPVEPLQVYLAVRHGGYWAEGFTVLSRAPWPAMVAAEAMLDKAIGLARPGAPHRDLARMLENGISIHRSLSATREHAGHSIGLALQEPASLNEASDGRFAAGEVYTVRVGLHDGDGAAIVSAMIAITQDGYEVLWRGADA
jgi:Xaa-Pro aminopeptidase